MDEEITDGYSEPCSQCGSVCWGVSDGGQFFCKNCHNVIERMKEVEDMSTLPFNSRLSSLSSAKWKNNGKEGGRDWMVCEGFQLILKLQAEALVDLGVCPQFKTDVLWIFWKRYLQNTGQAYAKNNCSVDLTCDGYASDGRSSVHSGSLDAECYLRRKGKKSLMSMPRTLAFCHLALLWVREAITLADLLRLVTKGHIPYVNVHELFPEEMRVFGSDAAIFRVESIPSYRKVHKETVELATLIELPVFPPVSQNCLLHPALLTLRYLMDANLPDKLHALVCDVIQRTSMGRESFLTFDPTKNKPTLLCYELQAAALIIVTMKLLFRLEDNVVWNLAREADARANEMDHGKKKKKTKQGRKMFNLRTWFMIVQPALERARKKEEQAEARQHWKSKKPIISSLIHKTVILKRRRVVEQLQRSFQTLSGSAPEQQLSTPSTFLFHWGDEEGADGPSLHHKRLDYLLMKKRTMWHPVNRKYWHTDLRKSSPGDHYWELKPTLPRIYVWLLGFFSFILGVKDAQLHRAVVQVEQCLLGRRKKSE